MPRILISSGAIFALFFQTGCIHTNSFETKNVQISDVEQSSGSPAMNAEIKYVIYREAELPLAQFFTHLNHGDYKEAFRRIHFNYRSANVKNEALQELIAAKFVPVYITIKNGGSSVLEFDEKNFVLDNGNKSATAFYAEQLPSEFAHFSPQAVAANIYNTAVVIVGFAAVLAVLVIASKGGSNPDFSQLTGSPADSQGDVYNSTTTKTKVNYQNYLIKKTRLNPGAVVSGLLFFYDLTDEGNHAATLKFQGQGI